MAGSIPKQIHEFKIILVKPRDKRPLELWSQSKNQYSWNDKKVSNWLSGGGNYGVVCGDGLVVFDFDNPNDEDVQKVKKFFGETFAVKSGSGLGVHLYYKIPGYNIRTTRVNLSKGHIDIRGQGSYVVGPGCTHPTGGTYDVISDLSVKIIKYEKYMEFLGREENESSNPTISIGEEQIDVDELESVVMTLPYRIRELIVRNWNPNDPLFSRYHSRSERDMAIIRELVFNNLESYTKAIFSHFSCGDKYREKGKFGDSYLETTLKKAFGNINITDSNMRKLIRKVYLQVFSPKKYLMNVDTEQLIQDIASIDDENIRDMFISELQKKGFHNLYDKVDYYRNYSYQKEVSVAEMIQRTEREINFWIEPFVIKGGITMIAGAPGSMKSLLGLFLSLAAISNKSVNNIRIFGKPKILYYDLENPPETVVKRLHSLMRGMGISSEEIENRLYISNSFSIPMIRKEIERAQKYDIIVLDSYRRFFRGEESRSKFVNKFYNDFLLPMKKLGKSIVIIHHLNKAGTTNTEDIIESTAVRGSSDIVAQLDLLYLLQKYKNNSKDKQVLNNEVIIMNKKDREGIGEYNFLMSVKYDKREKTNAKTEINIRETAAKSSTDYLSDKILEYIKSHGTVSRLRAVVELQDILERSKPRIYALIKDLIKQGFVKEKYGILSVNEVEQFVSGKDDASRLAGSENQPSLASPEFQNRSLPDQILSLLEEEGERDITYFFTMLDFPEEKIREAIKELERENEIFEPKPGVIKKL